MELGSQIKKYRNKLSLSQDALAEKIYVSRQTISKWENEKSYPDVNRLDEIEKDRENGKQSYQKALLIMGSGIITLIIAVVFGLLLK